MEGDESGGKEDSKEKVKDTKRSMAGDKGMVTDSNGGTGGKEDKSIKKGEFIGV